MSRRLPPSSAENRSARVAASDADDKLLSLSAKSTKMVRQQRAPKLQSRARKPCVPSEVLRLEEIQKPIRARLDRRTSAGSPASAPTRRLAEFRGSACLIAQNQYIDWQEFYLWVRSILEVEDRIPDWLAEILNARVPGFLETERALTPKAAKTRPLASPPGRLD